MNEKASWKRRCSIDIYSLFWASINWIRTRVNDGVSLLLSSFLCFWQMACMRSPSPHTHTLSFQPIHMNRRAVVYALREWNQWHSSNGIESRRQPLSSAAVNLLCHPNDKYIRTRMPSTLARDPHTDTHGVGLFSISLCWRWHRAHS